MHTRFFRAGFIACTLLFAGHAIAHGYKDTQLPSLSGGNGSLVYGINNAGQIVGTAIDDRAYPVATLWSGGTATPISHVGDDISWGQGINDSGQTVGIYNDFYGRFSAGTAFSTTSSGLSKLSVSDTYARDINNHDVVVGAAATGEWAGPPLYPFPFYGTHAVMWDGASAVDLNPAGASFSEANAINDSGTIAGQIDGNAATWSDGSWTVLGAGSAADINNNGLVAGTSNGNAVIWNGTTETILGAGSAAAINVLGQVVGSSGGHAFLWSDGIATDLNNFLSTSAKDAGWVLTEALGINDRGWIIANAFNSNYYAFQGFLLSPAPEPSTWAMLLAGLGFIGWKARGARRAAATPVAA